MTQEQLNLVLKMVVGYMGESKDYAERGKGEGKEYEEKVKGWGETVNKMEAESQLFNKEILGMMEYLNLPPNSQKYPHSFLDLNFDLSDKEVKEVAGAVRNMCRTDPGAFSFLSNYMVLSCLRMEEQGTGLKVIEETYLKTLKGLCEEYPLFHQT